MSYLFYSKNSDLHFSINNHKEFKRFCRHLKIYDDELSSELKKIVSKLKKDKFVFVDKFYTQLMFEYLNDHYTYCCYEDLEYLCRKGLNTEKFERELVDVLNLLKFFNFLKSFNEEFIICREDQSEIVLRNLSNNEKLIDTLFQSIPENQVYHPN